MTVALLAAFAAATGAEAQQPPGTRLTCSGIRARCDQRCPAAFKFCPMNCEASFNQCMQSGAWRGPKKTFTNVERR